MKQVLSFVLNGAPVDVAVKPTATLLDVLREQLYLTGTKRGCDDGDCGTCTILMDGEPARACLTLALTVEGKAITTVEGLAGSDLQPLQKAFLNYGATQCGFCTPGMLLVATALLGKNPHPTHDEIVYFMSGNLCRCGTYQEVIDAIQAVADGKVKEL